MMIIEGLVDENFACVTAARLQSTVSSLVWIFFIYMTNRSNDEFLEFSLFIEHIVHIKMFQLSELIYFPNPVF